MCNLSHGIAEKSKLETLYKLVKKGRLTLNEGAEEAAQTVEESKAGMDAYYAQLASV